MKRLKDESGQALIITALAMTCLLGFVALATDVGVLLREKRLVQIAADSAAIAGAAELNYNDVVTAAQTAATQNGFTAAASGTTVLVNGPPGGPQFGPYAGNNNYVEVIVSQDQPTVFMGLFGRSPMTVTARAVAGSGTTKGCVYTLGTSGADLSIVGNANIQIQTCGIIDDSSSNNALTLQGNATLNAQSIGVVGGVSKTGNVTVNPTPVTGIVAASDPLSFLPAPTVPTTCSANPNFGGNRPKSLSPGCYTGLTVGGTVHLTLGSGLYVINGPLSLGGNVTVTGANVTLDLLGSSTFPGNTALNLTAPTSGTYNGVLIYQPSSNTNLISLTGNSGATLKGIVYAPNAAVSITGNSGSSIFADFVTKSLSLVGNASFNDYASINANSVLTSVKLVE
jgi:Flp pilus assembly protein TadG